jgi:RNA polymerase sigma-70 factor (ECF subfamily)
MNARIGNRRDDSEDLRWVSKARTGNQKAFEKLVVKYQKRIYSTVRRMVLDHDDTNDIVQDTFVKVYTHLHRFDDRYPFYPWLHRIAINTTLNHQKKRSRRKEHFATEGEMEFSKAGSADENPMKETLHRELEDRIAEAMERLPFDQRIVFVLRTSDGLSYQEISEQLNVSVGTVMSRLSRAREKLRDLLKPYLDVED